MGLAAAARAVVDTLGAAGAPRLEDLTVDEARAASREIAATLFAAPLADVHTIEDVDADGVAARLYVPTADAADAPVVVHLHGGGWVLGDLDQSEPAARTLAAWSACRVLDVDYRRAPEHPFPAALDDTTTALRWVARELTPRLAVAGESAGGNLAAAAALRARDDGEPAITFQLLVCPVVDARCASPTYDEFGDGHLLDASAMRWFRDHYTDEPSHPLVSPLLAPDLSGLPPTLVVTAECDPLRHEAEAYAERLRAAGVDAVTSRYVGMVHAFTALPAVFPDVHAAFVEETGWALRDAFGLGLTGTGAEEVAVDGRDEAFDRVDDVTRPH